MALQVCKLKNSYLSKGKLHLIRSKKWGPASERTIATLLIRFWCEPAAFDRTPSKNNGVLIEPYNKEVHKKELCEECVKAIRATIK